MDEIKFAVHGEKVYNEGKLCNQGEIVMNRLKQNIILFDLDGTLTDSMEGVIRSAQVSFLVLICFSSF